MKTSMSHSRTEISENLILETKNTITPPAVRKSSSLVSNVIIPESDQSNRQHSFVAPVSRWMGEGRSM